jgi:hypothetical protein
MLRRWRESQQAKAEQLVIAALNNILPDLFHRWTLTLDPAKSYILVLPITISSEDTRKALSGLGGSIHMAVLHADSVNLIELE